MQFVPHMPSSASSVGLQQMHGVASRVAPSATAFPHRAEQYDFLILSQWSDATDSDRNIQWTRALFQAMQPHLEKSVYVNNLGDEGPGGSRRPTGRTTRAWPPSREPTTRTTCSARTRTSIHHGYSQELSEVQ